MIQPRHKLLNWFSLALTLVFLCGAQTSLWYQITKGAPAPQLWILVFLYLVLFRTYFQAMTGVYALTIFLKAFSAISLGVLWPVLFILVTSSYYFKRRMFWPSTKDFVVASIAFVAAFNIISFIISRILEENPVPPLLLTHAIEIALTALFAAPVYWLLKFIDQMTIPPITENHEGAQR